MINRTNKKNNLGHTPRKRFGQNFLQSQSVIHEIMDALHLQPADKVIEIGPGLGALTKPLLQGLSHLIAIEIDRDLQAYWLTEPHANQLELVAADALRVDYSQWGESLRLIGNLPYNISTPLLFHLLHFAACIKDMHFMLQKEVADRLAALPGNKNYGRLSIMVQYCCEVTVLFDVPPESFDPPPKVNSALVRLRPHVLSPYEAVNREKLAQVVAEAFGMRRKTLANNLKSLLSAAELLTLNIDPVARPEQIALEDYVRLTHYIHR